MICYAPRTSVVVVVVVVVVIGPSILLTPLCCTYRVDAQRGQKSHPGRYRLIFLDDRISEAKQKQPLLSWKRNRNIQYTNTLNGNEMKQDIQRIIEDLQHACVQPLFNGIAGSPPPTLEAATGSSSSLAPHHHHHHNELAGSSSSSKPREQEHHHRPASKRPRTDRHQPSATKTERWDAVSFFFPVSRIL